MRIVIIDDDAIVRTSLKTILTAGGQVEVAAEGGDGSEALPLYETYRPDVLLMDIRMKRVTGIEGGEAVLKLYPEAKILFLTTFSDDEYIVRAFKMGARGYILKQDFEGLVPALDAVTGGHLVFGQEVIDKLAPALCEPQDYTAYGITEREFELIRLVADGLSNREAATRLYLSEGTVRNYLSAILEKLALRDRTQLAIFYYKHLA